MTQLGRPHGHRGRLERHPNFKSSEKYIIKNMPYKIKEHIADIRIAVHGKNLEQLFTDVFLGIMYIMKPLQKFAPEKAERDIALESLDTTALLVDFINQILSLASSNKESYTNIIFYKIHPTSLRAKLFGFSVESFHRDIKALTYHEAEVRQLESGAWETIIALDR